MPKGRKKASPRKVASKKSRRLRSQKKQESNPFNRITAKNLHNAVLGQKVKGNVKRPGHSISRSIEKRKQSLLKEYTAIETNKHNTFIDKRYEKTLETKLAKLSHKRLRKDQKQIEKMIRRLTSQRLKSNKKVSFNLDEDELTGNDFTLTHLGAPINDEVIAMSNRGVDIDIDDDDGDNKYLYKGFNKRNIYKMIKEKGMTLDEIAESAGVSLNKFENKTKPQIIKQQILRSRYKKCVAQIENEKLMNETDAVDSKYKESIDWLFANRSKQNNYDHGNMRKAIRQKKLDLEYQQKLIEFEKDERSGVTDRAVTDLQKAQKNYELLCQMEKKRQRKELQLPSDTDEDEDGDLDDTNMHEDMDKLEQMFDRAQKGYSDEEEEEEQIAEIMDGSRDTNWDQLLEDIAQNEGSDDEGSDNEQFGYDADIDAQFIARKGRAIKGDESDEDIEIGCEPAGQGEDNIFEMVRQKEMKQKTQRRKDKLKRKRDATFDFDTDHKKGRTAKRHNIADTADWNVLNLRDAQDLVGENALNAIPFTLDVPESIEDFEALMSNKSASQQITLLKRMRSTNHIQLNEKNKVKMERLYDMLLDYFGKLCLVYEPTKMNTNVVGALQKDIGFYQYIDVITRALFALSHDIPEYAYSSHIKKLEMISMHIQKNYNLKSNKHFEHMDAVSYMPSGYALFYLRLVSHIFPTQNKANPVISAVLLILSKIVTDIRVSGPRDIACCLYCIALILQIIQNEKRYVPEVIHSLHNVLRAGFLSDCELKKSSFDLLSTTDDLYFTFGGRCNVWNSLNGEMCSEATPIALPLRWIFLKNNDENVLNTNEFKIQSLHSLLTLLFKSHEIWHSLLAYSEIFEPFYVFLKRAEIGECVRSSSNCVLSEMYSNVMLCLEEGIKRQSLRRKPLQLIHRQRAIPSLEPDFDPNLKPSFLRLKVRNETALRKKQKRILKKAVKKQQKAVMNEFRKDTQFIMSEKTKNRIDADNKRHAKWEHEWHNLTEQQRDTNSFQMVGKKLKKKLMKKGVIRGF
eukprot:33544_1